MIDGKTANEIFDSIRQHIIAGTLRAEDSLPRYGSWQTN
ncbi:transcriptional regulator [Salmonella enterica subsp. enterica]|uniref:Transcriptional regulator n=1 Tax=Salmonella enterica I TaxID=59201 RepID=A0A447P5Z4_SALET|nr:transcriptional regulator [Salmonella enterica subsp. enterica]